MQQHPPAPAPPSAASGGDGDKNAESTPTPTPTTQRARPRRPRVLLGLSGSVAAIKAPLLASALCEWADVRVVATKASRYFVEEAHLPEAARPMLGVR